MAIKKDIIGADIQIGTNEAQASMAKLGKETADLTKETEALSIQRAKLVAQGKKNSDDYKRLGKEITANNKKLKENKEQVQALGKTLGITAMSANQLSKKARDLKAQMNGMSKSASPVEWGRLNKELEETNKQFDKVRAGSQKTQGFLSKLKGAAGGLLPAFGWGALIAGAVSLGKKIYDLAKQTFKYRQEIQKLTDLQGKELADTTASITASAKTFNKEVNEMAIANNALAKAFDLTNQQAQDLIDKGFLAGADATGEFLDQIKEYPAQFKAAGLSAEESIAIITQTAKSGIYSDKGADAIKEATLRLREMTPATKDALKAIGISSDELQKKLRDGSISYGDAIAQVSEQLGKFPEQSVEVGTALADIFGGAGEDAGIKYIKTLANVEGGLDKMIQKTGQSATAQQKLLSANKKLEKAWSDLLGTGVGAFDGIAASLKLLTADALIGLMEGLKDISAWFVSAYNDSKPFRSAIEAFFYVWDLNIGYIKLSLGTLWDTLIGGSKLILSLFTFDKDKISSAFNDLTADLGQNFKDFGTEARESFEKGWENVQTGKLVLPAPEVETASGQKVDPETGTPDPSATPAAVTNTETPAEKYRKETEELLLAQEERLIALKERKLEENLGDEEFDALLLEQKALFLEEELLLAEQFKENTIAIESEIIDYKLLAQKQEEEMAKKALKRELKTQKAKAKIKEAEMNVAKNALGTLRQLVGEESALGKALFVVEQGLAVASIIKDTAVANAKAVAASPTTGGMPFVAINTISGALGVASVLAQTVDGLGFKSGGYTDTATSDDEISDFVHANEFVANAKAVRNPTVRPVLDTIDAAQRNGTIESINLPDAVGSGTTTGNTTDQTAGSEAANTVSNGELMSTMSNLTVAVNNMVENGIAAYLEYDGYKEANKKMDDLEKDVSFGS